MNSYIPEHRKGTITVGSVAWHRFTLDCLFELDHGDFNSYGAFPAGDKMIVGRSADNNGLVGYYAPPRGRPRIRTRRNHGKHGHW